MTRGGPTGEAPLSDDELMAAALEHESVGVAVIRLPDLTFEYVNPAFQAFAPGKEMIGLRNDEVFPEMSFLETEVLLSIKRVGDSWRAENIPNRIRRYHDGPLEDVYGTYEITRIDIHGSPHLLVTAQETTETARLSREYERLHEGETRRLQLSQTLTGVNAVIHSSLDYDEIMNRALEECTKALGARAGAVFVGVNGESEARYVFGFPRSFLGRRFSADLFPFSSMMEERKAPIPVSAEEMGTLMPAGLARLFRVRSLLAIPLVIRGELMGGIGLIYRAPHAFTAAELDFAASFGASVSLALENADLYAKQGRVADTLQEALLTMPEYIHGLTFGHAYRSAGEAVKVGGDFYDLFELEHDRVGFTVGDISGKGLEAAVLTSLVKHAVRAQAIEKRNSPSAVMKVVNKVLHESSEAETFATVFFGILDCLDGSLVYCNAGHTTSALIRAGGGVERLSSNSQLVGALPRASFADDTTRLEHRDMLLMYTDGVTEARRETQFFGEERLMALLEQRRYDDPRDLALRVLDEVVAFSEGPLIDDIAILSLMRAEEGVESRAWDRSRRGGGS